MINQLPKRIAIVGIEKNAGRTTLASSFFLTGMPGVFVDCDMNSHQIFQQLPSGHVGETPFTGTPYAEIDTAKCNGCMMCVHNCRYKAIFVNPEGMPEIDHYSCEACFACQRVCKENAVKETICSGGKWLSAYAGDSILVGAKLTSKEKNNADYIFQLAEKASEIALKTDKSYVIIDGPAGEYLPVLAAITGASRAIIVAAPTWNTFERFNTIINIVNSLKISASLIINKADMNNMITHQLKARALKNNIHLLAEIPYDINMQQNSALKAQTTGRNKSLDAMKEMWESILADVALS